jgi:hypothetical protein
MGGGLLVGLRSKPLPVTPSAAGQSHDLGIGTASRR